MKAGKFQHRVARTRVNGCKLPELGGDVVSAGVNICTELWALETYATYAALGVELLLSPRATALGTTTRWVAVGVVAAVRSGAFSLSSNRVDPTGGCGSSGWIIDPAGEVLAMTQPPNLSRRGIST